MNKQIIAAVVIAFILGGLELRGHVVSLEAQVTAIDKRVERIERSVDASRTFAVAE